MDPTTLERLLKEQSWMRGLARQLVLDEAAADDLVQQTWIDLLRSPPRRLGDGVRGFLATVLRRRASKQRREEGRRARRESIAANSEELPSAASLAAQIDAQRELVEAVLALDEPYRETVILRWFKEMPPSAIATERGIPIGTVESRLKRAHALLRDDLHRRAGGDRRGAIAALMPLAATEHAAVAVRIGVLLVSKSFLASAAALVLALGVVAAALWSHSNSNDASIVERTADPPSRVDPPQVAVGPLDRKDAATSDSTAHSNSASAAQSGVDRTCRIRVLDPRGGPVVDARLLLDLHDTVISLDVTDARGDSIVRLSSKSASDADLYVFGYGRAPSKHRIDVSSEVVEVRLERGRSIEGRVVVSDAPPRFRTRVSFFPSRPSSIVANAPSRVYDRANPVPFFERLEAECDAAGRFAFEGLDDGDAGELRADSRFYGAFGPEADSSARATAPATNIVLRLAPLPILTGRIVSPAGRPLARARVRIDAKYAKDAHSVSSPGSFLTSEDTDPEGRFVLALPRADLDAIEITAVYENNGRARRRLAGPLAAETDVGELRLDSAEMIRFRAVDRTGVPIEGAIAVATGDLGIHGTTGADGYGTIAASPEILAAKIFVFGERYDGAYLPGGSSDDETRTVVLTPATRVIVRPMPANGSWPWNMEVRAVTTSPLALDRSDSDLLIACTGHVVPYDSENGRAEWRNLVDREGKCVLDHLAPGAEWTLSIHDGNKTLASTTIVLSEGEDREVELHASPVPRTLRGIVHDSKGAIVRGARVVVIVRDTDGRVRVEPVLSDGDGRFVCSGLFVERVDLNVIHSQFAWKRVADVAVPEAGADIDIALTDGAVALCRVVDSSGAPVVGATVELAIAAWTSPPPSGTDAPVDDADTALAEDLGDGHYRFPGSFAGTLDGRVRIHGKSTPFSITPSAGEITVRVDSRDR